MFIKFRLRRLFVAVHSVFSNTFSSVQSNLQTSRWYSYFKNALVTVYHKTISRSYNSCYFLLLRDRIVEMISAFLIMRITNESTLNGKGGEWCRVLYCHID